MLQDDGVAANADRMRRGHCHLLVVQMPRYRWIRGHCVVADILRTPRGHSSAADNSRQRRVDGCGWAANADVNSEMSR